MSMNVILALSDTRSTTQLSGRTEPRKAATTEPTDIAELVHGEVLELQNTSFNKLETLVLEKLSLAQDSEDKRILKAVARIKRKMDQAPRRKLTSRNQILIVNH